MDTGAIGFIKDLLSGNISDIPATPHPQSIGEYVASSCFLHSYDSFSYLSAAWNATLQGDSSTAVHLAYYSELRSAMCLLACDGIGVFDDSHCVVDNAGNAAHIIGAGRTHSFCWEAYNWWSSSPNASSVLNSVVIDGYSIVDWLTAFPSGVAILARSSDYLQSIGLDIALLAESDQRLRGRASYRPRAIEGIAPRIVSDDLLLVRTLGESLVGPDGPRNGNIGLLILCAVLRQSFENNHGINSQGRFPQFEREVKIMIKEMPLSATTQMFMDKYCLTDPLPTIPVLSNALGTNAIAFEGILTRASLLCYHSVLKVRQLLIDSGVTEDDLAFWWTRSLLSRGAISSGDTPTTQDIAADALTAHDEFKRIGSPIDRKALWDAEASIITNACRCERLAVAGLFA